MPTNYSPIDWKKVLEGRAIVNDEEIKDAPILHKMFILFDKRPDLLDGLSVNEIALILFEHETYYDKKRKRTLPDKFAYDKVERYIQILNGWVLNKSQAIYATKDRDGKWRYYNKQKMKEYVNTEKHGNNIYDGIKAKQEKIKKIIKTPTKTKQKNSIDTKRFIRMEANKRKRKGDDFYG